MRIERSFTKKVEISFCLKLAFVYFCIQNFARIILFFESPLPFSKSVDVFWDGLFWDLLAWSFIQIPLLVLDLLLPKAIRDLLRSSLLRFIFVFLFSAVFIFVATCEIIFWSEFHSRFNFIAVDYLIYTNEVIANIRESYSLGLLFSTIGGLALVVTSLSLLFPTKRHLRPFKARTVNVFFSGLVFPIVLLSITDKLGGEDHDFRNSQLERNGVVEFVRAFRNNSIRYRDFYATIPNEQADRILKSKSKGREQAFFQFRKRPNVMVIVIESLGAKFIKPLGGSAETTPFLNDLSEKSIFFDRLYSTGTRTVRGLEAINLSVPPTPGYAVVKRPAHKGLYSLGETFKNNGYDNTFLYGGRGFFDNMNSFFEGNQFRVIDQTDFKDDEITFKNAWGVCDEDLYSKARNSILSRNDEGPFLYFLLTTSNHRPFTYPNGKISIKSGTSRAGAVRYSDFALEQFFESIKSDPWFKDTVFVIVADHGTEGRGNFDLEVSDFHIPLWIYSPQIQPQRISKVGSLIDVLPTLIDVLDFNDSSPFFGHSLLAKDIEERAFLGNYQFVGLFKNNILTTLGPNRVVENFSIDSKSNNQIEIDSSPFQEETISYYQHASDLLDNNLYQPPREKKK